MAAVAEAKLDLRESPDQLWWRQLFWDDMDAAAATGNGNGPHKECQLFLANTELRLITDVSKSQHDREQVAEWLVMGWDKEGEGVWVWEPNPRTFQQILEIYHTRGSYCGWLDALERSIDSPCAWVSA
ncbi:hypothetical protein NUU61_006092 [Penicillium alfredii]|uniref:Uncharacterized protein n=1 Tax=Penicillium alfredii TaxID=1506179 RepID=A0A9W9F090_9EURO|nr:uncharacterized protein NUU61_006092 [Penicillium alfredii]KAJ5091222.1 hypothetical protein NUU61_006092 [Penicillium alfredii]